jgi:oxygen-dependent protoporphyrinogen oxidase
LVPESGDRARRSIAVVGGGVAGLAAAHRVREIVGISPPRRVLYEASDRLGGTIRSHERDGFLLEDGPDSFLTEKPAGRSLVERLGLGSRLIGVQAAYRKSFIVHRGRLVPTPEGFQLLAPVRIGPFLRTPLLSAAGKLRILLEPLVPARRDGGDESLASFVERRLGREALDRLAQPMIAGIYGADPALLSLASTFPRFLEMERRDGSVLLGLRRAMRRAAAAGAGAASGPRYGLFAAFDRGMGVLTERLAASLQPEGIRLSSPVTAIARDARDGWIVRTTGAAERYDAVLIALPAPAAARLLSPLDDVAGRLLAEIPYGAAATVSLAYRSEQIAHPMDGAGFVVPAIEGLSLLGCTFCHRKYAGRVPEGFALLRAFHGEQTCSLDDAALIERTCAELEPLLGVRGAPQFAHLARYDAALPRYPVGHAESVARIVERMRSHRGLALAGPPAVGAGIPDMIAVAEAAADALLAAG